MPEYQQVTRDLIKTPLKYYIMYTHARYYIILLRSCTKVIKVCKVVKREREKEGRKEGRKEGQRGGGVWVQRIKIFKKCK